MRDEIDTTKLESQTVTSVNNTRIRKFIVSKTKCNNLIMSMHFTLKTIRKQQQEAISTAANTLWCEMTEYISKFNDTFTDTLNQFDALTTHNTQTTLNYMRQWIVELEDFEKHMKDIKHDVEELRKHYCFYTQQQQQELKQ